jgi:Ca-activated chloride channel family protein
VALAASLLVAVGAAYAAGVALHLASLAPSPSQPTPWLLAEAPVELFSPPDSVEFLPIETALPSALAAVPDWPTLARGAVLDREDESTASRPLVAVNLPPTGTDWLLVPRRFPEVIRLQAATAAVVQGDAAVPVPSGAAWPSGAEFPWDLFRATGIHPALSPAAHASLRTSRVPLAVDPAHGLIVQREIDAGRWPDSRDVRVEDFLAALDYEFSPPSGAGLALYAAGGPSPFGGSDLSLLHLVVQTPLAAVPQHEPTHVVLAVDASAEMRVALRWDHVLGALENVATRLNADDRVSLVVFSGQASVLLDRAPGSEAFRLAEVLAAVEPEGETNLGYGLRAACELAEAPAPDLDEPAELPTLIVLLSDGGAAPEPAAQARISEALRSYVRDGTRLSVIDVSGNPQPDAQLSLLAEVAGAPVALAASTTQATAALVAALDGESQVAARGAELSVTFDPQSVLGYRLLGHEMSTAEAAQPASLAADLVRGQQATGLYELQLAPSADVIAEVQLRWFDPTDGSQRETQRTIRRAELAPSWRECRSTLAAAALAAEAAEVLRGSYFAQGSTLRDVLEGARRLPESFREHHRLPELLRLVEEADRLQHTAGRQEGP